MNPDIIGMAKYATIGLVVLVTCSALCLAGATIGAYEYTNSENNSDPEFIPEP